MEKQNIDKNISKEIFIRGDMRASFYNQQSLSAEDKAFNNDLRNDYKSGKIDREEFVKRIKLGELIRVKEKKNTICNAGIIKMVQNGLLDNLNYCALGDSTTSTAPTDIKLGHEIYRTTLTGIGNLDNVVLATAFFDEDETSGAFTEFGTFLNGTATVDSGFIFTHLLDDYNKPLGIALIIDIRYTFKTE